MVALAFKSSIVLAALAGTAVSSGVGQETLDRYRTQLSNIGPQAQPMASDGAIASTIAQWRALQQTDALPFDSYAGFLMAHPGWPNETANRRAAERQAGIGSGAPGSVVAFFTRYPPQSAAGNLAYARALQATGQRDRAYAAVRTAWRSGGLTPIDQVAVTTGFPGALSSDDQDARMDALLWSGQTSAAQRQLPLVSPAKRALFEARLAFRTNAPNASDLSAATMETYRGDAGYVADRAVWLRNSGASPSARAWLARPRALTTRPGNAGEWYEILVTNARGAANDGQWQVAYDIARQIDDAYPAGANISAKSYAERDEYTNLAWLGGQAAMKQLGRPADAMTLFDRYARGSNSPVVRARGYYWAGRAAEAAGRQADATAFYTQAAGYRDQYYGQLATERMGRALTPPPPMASLAIAPAVRAAFEQRETVRAVKFLGQIADWQDQTAFVRQIAADATTDTDHALAAELSTRINRPDLGVMVGRSALANGLSDYSAAGFPTVSVPAGYEDNWTIIHAISRQESQFDRAAISHAGARGLMQLMPATAREQSGKIGLAYNQASLTTDPNLSIMLGSSYFQRIYANYGSYPLAIAAYNAGGGNVNKWLRANGDPRTGAVDIIDWIEAIPYQETRNYVQRVIENAVVYDLMNPARAKSRSVARTSWYLGKTRPG
ncbi:lytic transglycosylase domain-containing protein [Sphingomonas sp. CFBP 8765]|uniref:lytic transglycosylase domain-containing protein n=1 Tax=unclassified Sphingomonas TaxID=196159 RepID=UPI00177D7062|nr:lytic transglycosylase domain-containing protein [Sphingomonas sp. CFBP 8765]MBD8471324.1 lytic transglycosylase domain-containing protein [Sphingomonas sp. CFBP 8765]